MASNVADETEEDGGNLFIMMAVVALSAALSERRCLCCNCI